MTDDAKREIEPGLDELRAARVTGAPRDGSKLSSDAVVVLSTGAALFATMAVGFIGLFIMMSNLFTGLSNVHVTREQRLDVVREIVRDDVEKLDERIRAIERNSKANKRVATGQQRKGKPDHNAPTEEFIA